MAPFGLTSAIPRLCLPRHRLRALPAGRAALRRHNQQGGMMLAGSVIPLGDALVTKLSGGPATAYYGIHGGTAAVMAAAGAVLLLS
ncbi:DUF4267 domain-containing protein [Streptomyces sp. RGM 3693]|uniref:DUF4267 domain-containing protein n=1 Tax=Streptomyces sp. RGM 3693 TaxID=3413284 RepID=UPI003D26CC70